MKKTVNQATCMRVARHVMRVWAREAGPEARQYIKETKPAVDRQLKTACAGQAWTKDDVACLLKSKTTRALEACAEMEGLQPGRSLLGIPVKRARRRTAR